MMSCWSLKPAWWAASLPAADRISAARAFFSFFESRRASVVTTPSPAPPAVTSLHAAHSRNRTTWTNAAAARSSLRLMLQLAVVLPRPQLPAPPPACRLTPRRLAPCASCAGVPRGQRGCQLEASVRSVSRAHGTCAGISVKLGGSYRVSVSVTGLRIWAPFQRCVLAPARDLRACTS